MPGRILNFGRSPNSSTSSLDDFSLLSKKKARSTSAERRPSMEHLKRASYTGKSPSGRSSPRMIPEKSARLDVLIESPPLVFYGPPENSTGALLSGQLRLHVSDPDVKLNSFKMEMLEVISTKKPVVPHCPECSSKTTEMFKWDFLKEPVTLKRGEHDYPFSYLLPGNLPATTHSSLGAVEYHLFARAMTESGEEISFKKTLKVQRALIQGNDKNSVRIFPPTNITSHITLPSVIHPIGDFPVELRMSGLVTKNKDWQTRWRLRKLNWRIDEHTKMISPACAKHSQKLGGDGKGILHQDTRTIGEEDIKHGWKTDYSDGDGQIEMEFQASINPGCQPLCDLESPAGLQVSHNLVLELIVAEETCQGKSNKYGTPTGAARVLRMQFNAVVTERSGLGISWDEEQPPMYEDVPASPPCYAHVENYDGPPLEHFDDLEPLH
ncbi:MAG: hypothetical protein M1819_000350 [Sarea resinae]|nr:MAG: hypothetical protein M1819_000350 [Sarea resinae]